MNKQKIDKEIRLANIADFNVTCRDADDGNDGGEMIIEGYAAVFESETLIGGKEYGFIERIAKGAFDGCNMKDVPLKYNHSDAFPILARTRNKSLTLTVDDKGLFIRAVLLYTQDAVDMYKRIKAGLIDKMSFAFTVADEEIEKGKTPKRTITKFERLFDVSVVDTPAYDETSIYARSLDRVETWRAPLDNEQRKDYSISNLIKQYKGA